MAEIGVGGRERWRDGRDGRSRRHCGPQCFVTVLETRVERTFVIFFLDTLYVSFSAAS